MISILLIGTFTPATALSDDLIRDETVHRSSGGITKLHTDFFTLMNRLKDAMPLTHQKVTDAGFELKASRISSLGTKITKVNPVLLKDGTILARIELREPEETPDRNIFFTLSIKARKITRAEFLRKLGNPKLTIIPLWHSATEEYGYSIEVGKFSIRIGHLQHEPDVLKGVSFDSTEESQQKIIKGNEN